MRKRTAEILATMSQELLNAHDLDRNLKTVSDAALQVLSADHASVRLCQEDGQLFVGARSGVASEGPAPAHRTGEGLIGWVAQSGQLARVDRGDEDPRFRETIERGYEVASVMSVPIVSMGNTLGVSSVSAAHEGAFRAQDEVVATLLASAAAQAVRTAELEQLAVTDSETQAYNRRFLLPRVAEEMGRAARQGTPLSLLLMDLDHFKSVNDCHGHAVGDQVLRVFVDRVRDLVRHIDVLVRRGGEEFVLIMPDTDEDAGKHVAERVRRGLSDEPLDVSGGLLLRQTVSIGVAQWDGLEGPAALDDRADRAMYAAKSQGRDRTVVADAPPTKKLVAIRRPRP